MNKYEIKIITKYNQSLISQETIFPNVEKSMFQKTLKLQEEEIKKALIKLGWLPPSEAIKVNQRIKELETENKLMRDTLETLSAQDSGIVGSTAKNDCMASIARAVLNQI